MQWEQDLERCGAGVEIDAQSTASSDAALCVGLDRVSGGEANTMSGVSSESGQPLEMDSPLKEHFVNELQEHFARGSPDKEESRVQNEDMEELDRQKEDEDDLDEEKVSKPDRDSGREYSDEEESSSENDNNDDDDDDNAGASQVWGQQGSAAEGSFPQAHFDQEKDDRQEGNEGKGEEPNVDNEQLELEEDSPPSANYSQTCQEVENIEIEKQGFHFEENVDEASCSREGFLSNVEDNLGRAAVVSPGVQGELTHNSSRSNS